MALPKRKISVIGLGYVGLPVAVAFSEANFEVVGFDTDEGRITELKDSFDKTFEVGNQRLSHVNIHFTNNLDELVNSDFHIITVPTPVTNQNEPDISFLLEASKNVGSKLKSGDIVVYESTVYPGCTEEDCVPVLEAASGLKAGVEFFVGYSPERINPGDPNHRFETILKIVSAQCENSLDIIFKTYAQVIKVGIYRAPSIKVAEAAKVIENTQRDLNIGFVNELSKIFKMMDIDTHDVLEAANTKWNFNAFEPGLVGGHCIGVDPYYLTSKALKTGTNPEMILSGRATNNDYPSFIADQCQLWVNNNGIASPKIVQLGLTFKEDVPDVRNSKAFELAKKLQKIDQNLLVLDPVAQTQNLTPDFRFNENLINQNFDVIVLAVPHQHFIINGWQKLLNLTNKNKIVLVMDIKARLERQSKPKNVELWRP